MEKKWEMLKPSDDDREKIWGKSRTFAGDVWYRFRKKPTAIAGFIIIVLMMALAFVGPLFTDYTYSDQKLEVVNIPPLMKVFESPSEGYLYITQSLKVLKVNEDGTLGSQLTRIREEADKKMTIFDDQGKEVALYYGSKPYLIADPETRAVFAQSHIWNKSYILGTDSLGRDIFTRLMYGARISLMVAFIAAAVNMVIGVIYGGISGYIGGNIDTVMMRIVDIISTIPLVLYVILIMVFLGNGFQSIIIAIGSVYWVDMARVVRGQVLSLKNQEFVMAAKSIGTSTGHILMRHLIPNALGSILVTVTMLIPSAIFMEAFLSYLGIGIKPPLASLGTMCNDAMEGLKTCPYQLFIPALVICIIMFAFNFVGDGLRDALDPKLKK